MEWLIVPLILYAIITLFVGSVRIALYFMEGKYEDAVMFFRSPIWPKDALHYLINLHKGVIKGETKQNSRER